MQNKTTIYIFPLLGIDKKSLYPYNTVTGNSLLVNSFLGIQGRPEYDNKLCLLLKYDDSRYEYLEKLLSNWPGLINSFEVDSTHTMYVYDIPETHKQSFDYILEGKYSKVFDEHKKQIVKFNSYPFDTVGKMVNNFLYRHEDGFKFTEGAFKIKIPRNQEADSIINLEKEKFKIKNESNNKAS